MAKKKKIPKLPRLKCPVERVFKDKRRKRAKKPTPEEIGDTEDDINE
ncbi:MAG: hypothetical protein V3W51_06725 [Candidatus Brocadiales bacterium]